MQEIDDEAADKRLTKLIFGQTEPVTRRNTMADLADLIERLKTGCVCIGSDEDNPGVEIYDVEGASDTMAEAAAALSGQTAVPVAVPGLEPVMWHCKDYADGWIRFKTADEAHAYQRETGCTMQIMYKPAASISALATPVSPAPDAGWREAFDEMVAGLKAALNMVDGDGMPPDWSLLRAAISKAQAAGAAK